MIYYCAGFIGVEDDLKKNFKLETSQKKHDWHRCNPYQVEAKHFTVEIVIQAQSLVVWAIHEGKRLRQRSGYVFN